ncbi:G protein-coupled receptor rhodopsin-like [Trinorchestia longiramus]|nr:G protein-coupled receptor rhodopsin-like [Trinorchestia longiramus]
MSDAYGYNFPTHSFSSDACGYSFTTHSFSSDACGYSFPTHSFSSDAYGYSFPTHSFSSDACGYSFPTHSFSSDAYGYSFPTHSFSSDACGYSFPTHSFSSDAYWYSFPTHSFSSDACGYSFPTHSFSSDAYRYSFPTHSFSSDACGYSFPTHSFASKIGPTEGIVLASIIFLSVFGNVLICLAVYTDRNLRKIGNLFVVSLAIADLFVACLVMTFALVNDLLDRWPFGDSYCDIWIAFDVMCSTASIFNLCAISLDRYIHIKDPLGYSRWMTKKAVVVAIAVIWVLSALVSFLPIQLGLHRSHDPIQSNVSAQQQNEEDMIPQCSLDLGPEYAVVSSCISFFLPCCVMIAIYSRLYHYAKKHVRSIKAQVRPVTLGSLEGDTTRPKKLASPYHVSESKAATTVGIIVGTFLTCWVPFFVVNIIAAYCKECIDPLWFKILTWCGYSNSSFNPIIYSIFNKEFRDAFTRILTAHGSCCGHYKPHYHSSRYLYAENYPSSNSACRRKSSGNSSGPPENSLARSCTSCLLCCFSCCCCCCRGCCSTKDEGAPRLPSKRPASLEGDGHVSLEEAESGSSGGCLQLPHRHLNGSSSGVITEYKELDISPKLGMGDRPRASSGERCLILEQVSTAM